MMKNQSTEISDLERFKESKGLKLRTVCWSGRLTLWGRLPSFRLSLISLAALRPFNGRGEGGGGFLVLQTRGNRSVDRPTPSGYPRYSSRYSGWVFSSIVWERRGQESTRHAYASFGSTKSGIFLTERIRPISSSSRRLIQQVGRRSTHAREMVFGRRPAPVITKTRSAKYEVPIDKKVIMDERAATRRPIRPQRKVEGVSGRLLFGGQCPSVRPSGSILHYPSFAKFRP